MRSTYRHSRRSHFQFRLFLCLCCVNDIFCNVFERKNFGVSLIQPMRTKNQPTPEITLYLINKFEAMLTLVSRQFSNVLVWTEDGIYHDNYNVYNHTYYHGGYSNLYQGNAAAQINRSNGSKILTVLYCLVINQHTHNKQEAISLTFEAAEKANTIFPGTVEGIVFVSSPTAVENKTVKIMEQYLYYLRFYKERAFRLGLKLGTQQDCEAFFSQKNESIQNLQNQILAYSNITYCGYAIMGYERKDPTVVATDLGKKLQTYSSKHIKKRASEDSKLFFAIHLKNRKEKYDNIDKVMSYWKAFSHNWTWVRLLESRIYVMDVFDDPDFFTDSAFGHPSCCSGLWRVKRNPQTLTEEYEEKFSGTIFTPEKPVKRWEPITSGSAQLVKSTFGSLSSRSQISVNTITTSTIDTVTVSTTEMVTSPRTETVTSPTTEMVTSSTTEMVTSPTTETATEQTIETLTAPTLEIVTDKREESTTIIQTTGSSRGDHVLDDTNNGSDSFSPVTGWNDATTVIVVSVVAGTAIVLAILFIIILQVYRTKKLVVLSVNEIRAFKFGTSENLTPHDPVETMPSTAVNAPYDTSLEISKHNIKIDTNHILGSGQFGCVFKATIKLEGNEKIAVALKVAKNNCQPTALKGLLSEIKVMAYLGKHSNIVAIKGAYTAEMAQGVVYVATELCSLGSLQGFLRKRLTVEREITAQSDASVEEIELCEDSVISIEDMVRWSYEIACGMEHLERKYVVHADLATRNVLLTSDKTAKIADFGLSRRMYNYLDYVKTQQEPLPWRWMAIESLRKMEFSSKSDVWSYAITLWEIFSNGDTPYPGLSWTNDFVDQLLSGLRPNSPSHAFSEIYGIMKCCWHIEPDERPCFSELTGFLHEFLGRRINRDSEEASTYLELEEME